MILTFFLFVGILIFLVVLKNSIESKFSELSNQIRILNFNIDSLRKPDVVPEKSIPEPIKPETKVAEIIEQNKVFTEYVPKETVKIETPNIVFETPKPIVTIEEPKQVPYVPTPSFWENFKEKNPDLEKFIGENLISKIGILILVLGISYFVKYSIDQGWISEPVRVGIGMLAGTLVLGVAHKLREKFAAFSSVFVAGAIAIFYFTIGIAFHDYKLFSQEVAFGIMVIITAFAALITIKYNRIELGILTLIGGFAVPFMVSTGSGNYVVLFTYILILDISILCIGYFKKWDVLNLLAFIFTTLLFGSWLFTELNLTKPHYIGALVFGFLFYVLFCSINIINNFTNKTEFTLLQMSVISANTLLFYSAGMAILNTWHPELRGLFTAAIAIFNLGYAYFIFKKFGADKRVLYLLIGLTLTFITLAIPIQFNGHYITMFWAAEAVMLLWLSQKSQVSGYKLCSIIVHILMLGSLILDWFNLSNNTSELTIILNPVFINGLICIISYFLTVKLLNSENESEQIFNLTYNPKLYSKIQFTLGLVVAYFVGLFETNHQSYTFVDIEVSATAVVWFYHLLFTGVLCYFLFKNQFKQYWLIAIIATFNILMFTFYVSGFAFEEHKNYISSGISGRTAFCLHYLSLALAIYFGFIIFKLYKNQQLNNLFYKPIFAWIGMFFIVYVASTELLIHGLLLSNSPVSSLELQKQFPNGIDKDQVFWVKSDLANEKIESVRTTIYKSGMPVLWGVLAFVFLIIGIRKPSRILRIMALSLLGLTIIKLFLYDIRNASETGRIIAFILLGVLILIISFVYQKLKVLIDSDNKPSNTEENE